MTANGVRQVVVSADDAPDDLPRHLREAGAAGRPVELLVPADSSLLLTASEFRALREAIDRERLAVTLVTPDPLRLQLAKLLGVPAVARAVANAAPPSERPVEGTAARENGPVGPAASSAPAQRAPTPSVTGPVSAQAGTPLPGPVPSRPPSTPGPAPETRIGAGGPSGPTPVVVPPALAIEANPTGDEPGAHWPDGPQPPAPKRRFGRKRGGPTPAPVGDPETRADDEAADRAAVAADPVADADEAEPVLVLPAGERRRRQHRGWLVVAGVIAGLIGLGVVLLPGATVALKMASAPASADIVYDVTSNGEPISAGSDLAVAAVSASAAVSWEGTVPTTGTQTVPDGTASGPVSFSNPTDATQTVAAGTELTTDGGTVFTLAEAVTVPGRDPATGRPGLADGKLVAAKPGGGGNVGTGEIGGKLPSGVYYSNRQQPTAGGTDKTVHVVAAADLDALRKQAGAAFPDAAAQGFAAKLASGQRILPSSLRAGTPAESFSAGEGDPADHVTLKVEWQTTGLAVDDDAISQKLRDAAVAKLGTGGPAGFAVDPASVKLGSPTPVSESGTGVRFRVPATGTTVAQLTQPQRRALAEQLAGADPASVDAILRQHPEIARWDVRYWPPFLPDRMPKNVGRIQLQVGH